MPVTHCWNDLHLYCGTPNHLLFPSIIHAWSPLTHNPSSPLNNSFSQGVHACNSVKHSADHCLNPWSVILCCYRSFDLCPSLSSSQTLQGKHACLMRYYLLITTPPVFSQCLDLILDPVSMGDHTWGDHLLVYKGKGTMLDSPVLFLASTCPHKVCA